MNLTDMNIFFLS